MQDRYGNKIEVNCQILDFYTGKKGTVTDIVNDEVHVKFYESEEQTLYETCLVVLKSPFENSLGFLSEAVAVLDLAKYYSDDDTTLNEIKIIADKIAEAVEGMKAIADEDIVEYLAQKYIR